MQPRRDADMTQATEHAAANAVRSFEALEKADSTAILSRIREAAEATPGGMNEVLSEMKPGGAFEDLRKEFNAALSRDEHFSNSYEHAINALETYADQRSAAAPALQKANASVLARLEALDEQIVKASTELPGKDFAKSAFDEAMEKGREAVKALFEFAERHVLAARPLAQHVGEPRAVIATHAFKFAQPRGSLDRPNSSRPP